jgi:hypothetical protein
MLLVAAAGAAHDIPRDATIHGFVKQEGRNVQVIVRAPLGVLRDIAFPEDAKGYLNVEALAPHLPNLATTQIADLIELYIDGRQAPRPRVSGTQISLESDRSFATFDQARSHIFEPMLKSSEKVTWSQLYLDLLFEYPVQSERPGIAIRPGFERLAAQVVTVLRYVTPEGSVRAYEFRGDPGVVPLDPSWLQAARRFIESGFFHILDGTDHLLFLLCLVIPFRHFRPLLIVVTAFTIAHSITLIASAFNVAPDALWFPPAIETLIAASIVYMALENIVGAGTQRRRWIMAFAFGLVHGFGFSFALRETLQFAGSHLLTSLLAFNVGVELGQMLVLLVFVPVLDVLFRSVVKERIGTIIISALVAHTGWHWMIERAEVLKKFR